MIENISGLKIKGKFFSDEAQLIFFPKSKDRISVIFGRNGSGKSTITEGIHSYLDDNSNNDLSTTFIDSKNNPITITEKEKQIFIFDEKYVDSNIKLSSDGLKTIILFGEQGNIDTSIKELEIKFQNKIKDEDEKKSKEEAFLNNKNNESPEYYLEKIKKKLKEDNGWADKDSRIRGNKTKSAVNDDKAIEICNQKSEKSISELEIEYQKLETLLKKTSSTEIYYPDKISTFIIDKNIDKKIISLLAKKISKPQLTNREKLIMNTIEQGFQSQIEKAKEIFSSDKTNYCPYCFQSVSGDYKKNLINGINKVLNKDVNEHKAELSQIFFPIICFDIEKYLELDKDLSIKINKESQECNKLIELYQKQLHNKQENVYSPIMFKDLHLYEEIETLNALLLKLEDFRIDFINETKQIEKNRKKLISLNKLIASESLEETFTLYNKKFKEKENNSIELKNIRNEKDEINDKISALKQKKSNISIATEIINKNLEYIFCSKKRLSVEPVNNVYCLKSNDKSVKPKDISCGERNIIGLCYFFTQIMNDSEFKNLYKQELLLVIDDPVSSFDFENKIGIISYLSSQIEKTVKGNSNSKIIILTHDLSAEFDLCKSLNSFCTASKNKSWELKTSCRELKNKNLSEFKYHRSEYTELFKFVYKYAISESNEGNLEIGNYMRRVLESFVTFSYKRGIKDFIFNDDILKMLAEKSDYYEGFLSRLLLHNESHFEEKLQVDCDNYKLFQYFSEDEKKITARNMICLLYKLNKQHVLAHLKGEKDVDQTIQKWYTEIPSNLVAK